MKNPVKKKKIIQFIRDAVKALPEDTYKAYHKFIEPRFEDDENGEKMVRYGYLQDHPVNHRRRCRHMYEKYGMKGIDAYLQAYGFRLAQKEN